MKVSARELMLIDKFGLDVEDIKLLREENSRRTVDIDPNSGLIVPRGDKVAPTDFYLKRDEFPPDSDYFLNGYDND